MVEITRVEDSRGLKRFIKFPFWLYRNNKYWVPPLLVDEFNTLSPDRNPAFEHCEAAYWLASINGRIVGRVAGIINHKFQSIWGRNGPASGGWTSSTTTGLRGLAWDSRRMGCVQGHGGRATQWVLWPR